MMEKDLNDTRNQFPATKPKAKHNNSINAEKNLKHTYWYSAPALMKSFKTKSLRNSRQIIGLLDILNVFRLFGKQY